MEDATTTPRLVGPTAERARTLAALDSRITLLKAAVQETRGLYRASWTSNLRETLITQKRDLRNLKNHRRKLAKERA